MAKIEILNPSKKQVLDAISKIDKNPFTVCQFTSNHTTITISFNTVKLSNSDYLTLIFDNGIFSIGAKVIKMLIKETELLLITANGHIKFL